MSSDDDDLASFDDLQIEQARRLLVSRWITVSAIIIFFVAAILTHIFYLCAFIHRRERRALSVVYQRMRIAAETSTAAHGQQMVRRRSSGSGLESCVIAALPKMSYEKSKNDAAAGEYKECAVCLIGLEEGEMVRVLPPCMHFFHVKCIDEWLRSHSTCPVCRGGVVKAN